jgi:hypothetical protein
MNEIYLSYRRADDKGATGRLFDHLAQAFGKDAIYYAAPPLVGQAAIAK